MRSGSTGDRNERVVVSKTNPNPGGLKLHRSSLTGCGVASATAKKVRGGTDSVKGLWPWMAFLIVKDMECGGVLISDQHILTAAHCFDTLK